MPTEPMTPEELLSPQPPTKPGEDQRAVWGLILFDLCAERYEVPKERMDLLGRLFADRDDMGAAKYGHRLPVDSGRNSLVDELQEALDGMVYSRQTYERARTQAMEPASTPGADTERPKHVRIAQRAWARHLRCLQTVLELLEELS